MLRLAAEVVRYLGDINIAWLQYIARITTMYKNEGPKLSRLFDERIPVTFQTSNAGSIHDWIVVGSSDEGAPTSAPG